MRRRDLRLERLVMPEPSRPQTVHVPVLLRETLRGLALEPGLTVVDGTLGGGGHALKILEQLGPDGRLIGVDRDATAVERMRESRQDPRLTTAQGSYADLRTILDQLGVDRVDRILVDLGLSSDQLADDRRGFSFQAAGPLDLRFDSAQGEPAWKLLQTIAEGDLASIFAEYGEEPASRKLAAAIVGRRSKQHLHTAQQLADLVVETMGPGSPRDRHPATRVFQALRIAVNRELDHLERALSAVFPRCLVPGGILAVISFHSLEDRLVKEAFRRKDVWECLTPKPIGPTPAEERFNPRSRSAKLRIARRVGSP